MNSYSLEITYHYRLAIVNERFIELANYLSGKYLAYEKYSQISVPFILYGQQILTLGL